MTNINKDKESVWISQEYKNLTEIFSEKKVNILSLHHDWFDHSITLKKNFKSVYESIYNLSEMELFVLKFYIEKYIMKEFI